MLNTTSDSASVTTGNRTKYETVSRKRRWEFTTLHELHLTANSVLRQAMLHERSKRWRKVVETYTGLLWVVSLDNLPDDYQPPTSYSMLAYELHYHLGVAYQQIGNQLRAVDQFTKSIAAISIAKNGCLAGCLTNSCLMTPIHARRAYAYSALGLYKLALKDAEKAIVLDSRSPDVYCIRALVRSTFDDELAGLTDLSAALTLHPGHTCATILREIFNKPLAARILVEEEETYTTCNSFTHACILEFYDKLLFPLSVPHTITTINLTPEKPSKKQLEANPELYRTNGSHRPGSASVTSAAEDVFRCGMRQDNVEPNRTGLQRRTDYANAIRKHMSHPKTAQEFFSQLTRQKQMESAKRRAASAILQPGSRFAVRVTACDDPVGTRPETAPQMGRWEDSTTPNGGIPAALACSTPYPASAQSNRQRTPDKQVETKPKLPTKNTIVIETPTTYTIPVFQAMNIKRAPRMYYRPWSGDKLPVSDRKDYIYRPAFY